MSPVHPKSSPGRETLAGRVALVTGSSSGIGLAVARALLQEGARVVLNARRAEPLERARRLLQTEGGEVMSVAADVSRAQEVSSLFKQIHRHFGPVQILVNNAGIARFLPTVELPEETWDEILRINLKSAYLCTRAALKDMSGPGGHIVMINSVAARKAFPGCAAYGASKAGLLAFTDVLREEVRGRGIRVTTIFAGATNTPLWKSLGGEFDPGRMMSAETVAGAVLSALKAPEAMVEEILLRPQWGDL